MPPPPHIRQKPAPVPKRKPPRRPRRVGGALVLLALLFATLVAIELPDHLNPFAPLDPTRAPNAVTPWQVGRSAASAKACFAALARAPDLSVSRLPDRVHSPQCHIRNRVSVSGLAGAQLRPVETQCATALRLYMLQRHTIAPAAQKHFGAEVSEILHFDSYSCRRMRTGAGTGNRMSEHATANAIDISGVVLGNGRTLSLTSGWDDPPTAGFWRDVRDGACAWFRTVLSPDYNALHADHFHLAQGRWRACR